MSADLSPNDWKEFQKLKISRAVPILIYCKVVMDFHLKNTLEGDGL